MQLRVCGADRKPLLEPYVLKVFEPQSSRCVHAQTTISSSVRIDDLLPRPYLVQVLPLTHRPVAQFVVEPTPDPVPICTPLDPDRVTLAKFPAWDGLAPDLQTVLTASTIEGLDAPDGAGLYAALTEPQRAGLLNLYAKMTREELNENAKVWTFVRRLYRVRQDRIFADVLPPLRDLVKSGARFRAVPGVLHTPPPGFHHAGSFKTTDPYGNLQLTFFCNDLLEFKVDADIDDAAGIGHLFQVIGHAVTGGTTHPYDIHQILTYRQDLTLPYTLE